MPVSSALAPVSEAIGACEDADMVGCSLVHLSVDRCQYYLVESENRGAHNRRLVTLTWA